ncbi:putative DNA replication complex GINS protein PSF1 [Diplonema papillatum]|nr:putative DNA replication complex GINS protein PSF1 [Diplonema papillatum]
MEKQQKRPFAWGGCATTLLRASKRARDNGDRLPPFAAVDFREVKEEIEGQVQRVGDLESNPHVTLQKGGGFAMTHTLLCEAALRNKRALSAYQKLREEALMDAFWQVGQNLPAHTVACLSPAEHAFFRAYASLTAAFMEAHDPLNLRACLHAPPQITDVAFVRGIKDFTYVSANTGEELVVRKGKFFVVTHEEATALMQQGSVEPVVEGAVS